MILNLEIIKQKKQNKEENKMTKTKTTKAKQYEYGQFSFLTSPRFTPAQKHALRKLRSECRKELVSLGEEPSDDNVYDVMTEGSLINSLMKIVFDGQDTSTVDFSKEELVNCLEPINGFFEGVQKKIAERANFLKK